jgi:hypothetical protein
MNKFFDWLGKEVTVWFTVIATFCIYVGGLAGILWFASWTVKGLLKIWGVM